jgi:D-alanyl-D-alanine endopeptidase (penicillin-binding protein 7)
MKTIRLAAVAAAWAICAVFGAGASAAEAPDLRSAAALIIDEETGEVLYNKNADAVVPIASITKLMTAMVVLDAGLPLDEQIEISQAEVALTQASHARSQLARGMTFTRDELLRLALMASENRAAAALGRVYPGGPQAFVQAMNEKAATLEMYGTRFVEPTGLSSANVATAADLATLVRAAKDYPLIREYSTLPSAQVRLGKRNFTFVNTNGLIRSSSWEIGVSKTGFINQAGRCLVMQARLAARSVIIVLLDSVGKFTRIGDANRIRQWLEPGYTPPAGLARAEPRPRPVAPKKPAQPTGRVRAQLDPPSPL